MQSLKKDWERFELSMVKYFETASLIPNEAKNARHTFPSRRILQILFWIPIPFVFWWFLRDIPLLQITKSLSRLNLPAISGLFLLNGLIIGLFSSRWWVILRAQGYCRSYFRLVLYRLAAFSVSYFTPGPQLGGEPLQIFLLKKRENVSADAAVASVSLDKLFELLANFTFLLIGILTIFLTDDLINAPTPTLLLLPAGLLIFPLGYLLALTRGSRPFAATVFALFRTSDPASHLWKLAHTIGSAERQIANFYRGNLAAVAASGLLSVLIWSLMIIEFHLALRWLGAPLNFPDTVIALTASRLAFLLPLPGGLGMLEASQVLVMEGLGIDPGIGISLSLLIRVRDVIFGGFGLLLGGLFNR